MQILFLIGPLFRKEESFIELCKALLVYNLQDGLALLEFNKLPNNHDIYDNAIWYNLEQGQNWAVCGTGDLDYQLFKL